MINLFSDTQTDPNTKMRDFMMAAKVGDEQSGQDPSVNQLIDMSCERFGKDAGIFLPSGIMCNLVALMTHCGAGDEFIVDEMSHIIQMEAGGYALGGMVPQMITTEDGIFNVAQLESCLNKRKMPRNSARSKLVCVENTHNFAGGVAWREDQLSPIKKYCKDNNLKLHMDGARVFNASVAMNISVKDYADGCDSIWYDLSKGLGCPMGAVLLGSEEFIAEAWRWKVRLGGALRQAGIVASAGVYALEHHIERLAEDHENAKMIGEALNAINGVSVDLDNLHTNIIMTNVKEHDLTAPEIAKSLIKSGVRCFALNQDQIRMVTHLDVCKDECAQAIKIFKEITA